MMPVHLFPGVVDAHRTAQQAVENGADGEPVLELGMAAVVGLRTEARAQLFGVGELLQQQGLLLFELRHLGGQAAAFRTQIGEGRHHRIVLG